MTPGHRLWSGPSGVWSMSSCCHYHESFHEDILTREWYLAANRENWLSHHTSSIFMRITLKVSVSQEQIGGWGPSWGWCCHSLEADAPFLFCLNMTSVTWIVCPVSWSLLSDVTSVWPVEVCTEVTEPLSVTLCTLRPLYSCTVSVHLYCPLYRPPHFQIRTEFYLSLSGPD